MLLEFTAIKQSYSADAYQIYRLYLKFTVFKMLLIVNCYKLMSVFIVESCRLASLFLVLQISIALWSELELSCTLKFMSGVCDVRYQTGKYAEEQKSCNNIRKMMNAHKYSY
jgi:hypothetical protein